ncbi:hypothetical protein Q4E93_13090 [Flavitalea sp. BT771]|uniref:hypothetical protein n=1 Tax=Flavitalea sp. BT771 TaxID=3063329 RepID=UPI0026E3727E|nr:hypothetical protein [Flavitalea sp. BT771]MDO6431533.1 hypothetical protein [Flavitalea sp. BT771]MDV6220441.1 hypothetical protein [Flavitalea sp. BT771]
MAKAASSGDKIDLIGKKPQFDLFARYAYEALKADELKLIRVGDPEAMKLDDIQYETSTEIHAFQVKWSGKKRPEPFYFRELEVLFPDLVDAWRRLRTVYKAGSKRIIGHLLSNRSPSRGDRIEPNGKNIGTFDDFVRESWVRLKRGEPIVPKWQPVIDSLFGSAGLHGVEKAEFIANFEIQLSEDAPDFDLSTGYRQRNVDLRNLSRLILETLASLHSDVTFTKNDILRQLAWEDRFCTTFNHELFVDPATYQQMGATMTDLTAMINLLPGGYIFLLGPPGTGKSSLITEWARESREQVIRYYAFDFTDPASSDNHASRGDSTSLFFDLVFQLSKRLHRREDTVLYRDVDFLQRVFAKQLDALGEQYKTSGVRTFIAIDGLDHIPREYQGVTRSLLSDLPAPDRLPEGVYIILGSQSFEMDSLALPVKANWKKGDRTVNIKGLTKEETGLLIDKSNLGFSITNKDKEQLFEVSEGHPLLLAYLLNKARADGDVGFLQSEPTIGDGIVDYYRRIWLQIEPDVELVRFLGLIARIRGAINLAFVKEWNLSDDVQRRFRVTAWHLFQKNGNELLFFHNSFRQFLVAESAKSPMDGNDDPDRDRKFHKELVAFHEASSVEPSWPMLYHTFMAGDYEAFLASATGVTFARHFSEFRPLRDIQRDVKLGLSIARQRNDPYLTIRFLFILNELSGRERFVSAGSFLEELIVLGKAPIAKRIIRDGSKLFISRQSAVNAVRWFVEAGDLLEAKLLLMLGQPTGLSANGVRLHVNHDTNNTVKDLTNWARSATLVLPLNDVLARIKIEDIVVESGEMPSGLSLESLYARLLAAVGGRIVKLRRWDDLDLVMAETDKLGAGARANRYHLSVAAAWESYLAGDRIKADEWLDKATMTVAVADMDEDQLLEYAMVYYRIKGDRDRLKQLITGMSQPDTPSENDLSDAGGLGQFSTRIQYNHLLDITGQSQVVTVAVPDSPGSSPEIVEFERMLCRITKLKADINNDIFPLPLRQAVLPIIQYFYRDFHRRGMLQLKLDRCAKEYFEFLITTVGDYGHDLIAELGALFLDEFERYPGKWSADRRRYVLRALGRMGFDRSKVTEQLTSLEGGMTEGLDVSGKVEAWVAQASAWLDLSEEDKGLTSIQNALNEAFGIGYRNDYQFNYWNFWLRKINAITPGQARRRIAWFVNQLPRVKHLSERSTFYSAADAVLETAFSFDLGMGVDQMIELLEKGLVRFDSAMKVCLKAFFAGVKSLEQFRLLYDCYIQLYLFFETEISDRLLSEALEAARRLMNDDELKVFLDGLMSDIGINALEENVKLYRDEILMFLKDRSVSIVGWDTSATKTKLRDGSAERLLLSPPGSGGSMDLKDVLAEVNSFEDLKRLMLKEDRMNSWFSWAPVINKISGSLTRPHLEELSSLFPEGKRDWEWYSLLAVRAHQLNDRPAAEILINKAIEASSSSGWAPHYDGGSRLRAFGALNGMDSAGGSRKALGVLIDDIEQASYYSDLTESIDDILPVVSPNVDVGRTWSEIEPYLRQLFGDEPDETGDGRPPSGTGSDPLARLIWYAAGMLANPVRIAGKKIFAAHLRRWPGFLSLLKAVEMKTDEQQRQFLETLSLAAVDDDGIVSEFADQLRGLACSLNSYIRFCAIALLRRGRPGEPLPVPPRRPLSPIYELKTAAVSRHVRPREVRPHESIIDTDDPMELLGADGFYVDILSEMSGISKDGILLRWGQLIREVNPEGMETRQFENECKASLQAINLNYTFFRPRSRAVKTALDFLVGELLDAGRLDPEIFSKDRWEFDFVLEMMVRPLERPAFVGRLQEDERHSIREEWVREYMEDKRYRQVFVKRPGNYTVVAEYTVLRSLDWNKPKQTYQAQLALGTSVPDDTLFFDLAKNCLYEDYHQQDRSDQEVRIVILNDTNFQHLANRARWLAIDPAIARSQGWVPSTKGHFAWENTEGKVMAESFYWRQGNPYLNTHRENEVGEGWFVVLANSALEDIREDHEAHLCVLKRITRTVDMDGRIEEETANVILGNLEDE